MMLTLTLDQKNYADPEEAMVTVGEIKRIPKLISKLYKISSYKLSKSPKTEKAIEKHHNKLLLKKRCKLRSREYTRTLEFHKPEKGGWPHWHLLVDCPFVCKHLLQAEWGLGHCWVSKHSFANVNHAINYATKYIVKTNAEEEDNDDEFLFPEWVYDYKGNVRRFSTSRGLCPTRKIKNRSKYDDPNKDVRARITKTGRQKVEACGQASTVLVTFEKRTVITCQRSGKVLPVTELQTKFVRTLEVPFHPRMVNLSQLAIQMMIQRQRLKELEQMVQRETSLEVKKVFRERYVEFLRIQDERLNRYVRVPARSPSRPRQLALFD